MRGAARRAPLAGGRGRRPRPHRPARRAVVRASPRPPAPGRRRRATGLPRQEVSYVEANGKLYLAGGPDQRAAGLQPGHQHVVDRGPAARSATPRPHPDRRGEREDLLHRRDVGLAEPERRHRVRLRHRTRTPSRSGPPCCRAAIAEPVASPRPATRSTSRAGVHDGTTVAWFDVYDTAARSWSQPARPPASARPLPGRRRGRPLLGHRRPHLRRPRHGSATTRRSTSRPARGRPASLPCRRCGVDSRRRYSAPRSRSSAARAAGRPSTRSRPTTPDQHLAYA